MREVRQDLSRTLRRSAGHGSAQRWTLAIGYPHPYGARAGHFARSSIRNPSQYDSPPDSVSILTPAEFRRRHGEIDDGLLGYAELVVYKIGMRKIRSDPYTGTSLMYRYLYVLRDPKRALVLWFPEIEVSKWQEAVASGGRKDVRLYSVAADAILFSDKLVLREGLRTIGFESDSGTAASFILMVFGRIRDFPPPYCFPCG